ncbi:MAG: tripartite tricarboxylate transporter TctB family protein [Thermodesulfobacteriota bacterium]
MRKYRGILFPGAMLAAGAIYGYMALKMPLGNLSMPGAGFYPTVVGAFLVISALVCLLQELRSPDAVPPDTTPSADGSAAAGGRVGRMAWLTALMIGYILALKPLGYPVSIAAFLVAATRIFGARNWAVAAIVAVVLSVVSYFAFIVWLKVPLPLGILDGILG